MITRAHIRRQLRKNGGIMNVTPRQAYGLGSLVKSITKPFKKVLDVGKQVIKSPVGKAALIGLGGAGLMGMGPLSGLSGIGARIGGSGIGQFLKGMGPKLLGTAGGASAGPMSYLQKGVQQFTPGLLGKLGLTKGGGSLMPTILGGVTAAGLMTYFMGKGKTEEEATQLAQDVKRGKGLGLDLIKADIKKYRTGDLSSSQMFDKGYHFLTPRDYIGAKGGRVGLQTGGIPTPYDVSAYEKSGEFTEGDLDFLRWNLIPTSSPSWYDQEVARQRQHWDPTWEPFTYDKWQDMSDILKVHTMREIGPYQRFGTGPSGPIASAITSPTGTTTTPTTSGGGLGSIIKKAMPTTTTQPAPTSRISMANTLAQNIAANKAQAAANQGVLQAGRARIKPAAGGRVKYGQGSGEGVEQMYVSDEAGALPKSEGGVLPKDVGKLSVDDFDDIEDYRRYIRYLNKNKKAQGGRIGKLGGGLPRIPMGMPRVNAGGISELDYRSTGGFVPVGVKEKADDVPAMLSKNEFVMTADAVKAAGGGSVEKGAQRMYDTMKRLEGKIA